MNVPVYLDHNATTPIDPCVIAEMNPYLEEHFGNPSSIEHEHGHTTSLAVEHARELVAASIGARPNEIIFTSGCTEANNLAFFGVARALGQRRHLIISPIEHPSVLETARALEREGWRLTILSVDEYGRVDPRELRSVICDETALVSVMAGNNEVGTLQPISEIGHVCNERGIIFHTDLAQVLAYQSINVEIDGIHLASISGHKAYGPKGVGALYIRSRKPRIRIRPIIYGGGQERGLRSGTLNPVGIVGLGAALELARCSFQQEAKRLKELCDRFRIGLETEVPDIFLNGHPTERLPGNLSFSISGVEPLALIRTMRKIASFSASSACATDKVETSHVLRAMFGDTPRARGAFRIAPGRFTTNEEMDYVLKEMISAISFLRSAVPTYQDLGEKSI